MNKKQYPLIPVEDGYVMVDKERRPKIAEYQYCYEDYFPIVRDEDEEYEADVNNYGTVIAHTGIPSLKDSGLLLMELPDEDEEIISKAIASHGLGDTERGAYFEDGFVSGYKAAGGYTEEDIRVFYKYVKTHTVEEAMNYMKQQKNKHPVAVIVEMELVDISRGTDMNDGYEPKVVNGYIQIKEVIYE